MLMNAVLGMLLLVSQFSVITVAVYTPSPDYTNPGPCAVQEMSIPPLQLPTESNCTYHCTLYGHVHAPQANSAGAGCPAGPYPVVVFFSGFQLSSDDYTPYAVQLASWGIAVVQYDFPALTIVADAVELGYLPYFLKHISSQPSTQRLLDVSRLATAGHSRGGKLAALHLAGTPGVLTAYVIDPVDSTSFSPPSPQNPSAAEALKGQNKRLGITGGGVSGLCNPKDSNWHVFWQVVGPDSWLELVPQAGHMQFTNISNGALAKALDLLCSAGKTSHEHVINLTAPALTAWMDTAFRCNATVAARAPTVANWVNTLQRTAFKMQPHQQQQRRLSWETMASSSVEAKGAQGRVSLLHQGDDTSVGAGSSVTDCSLQGFFEWVKREGSAGEITFQIKQ